MTNVLKIVTNTTKNINLEQQRSILRGKRTEGLNVLYVHQQSFVFTIEEDL